jgi:glycosyltransferase involved in cell wall biosynthesis
MSPAVSIVIPVYNGERYLEQCLESVCNQTLKNIEIIAVNDGSTDSSRDILQEYRQRYSNLIIIDQEKAGASAARNKGMECAKGDYIGFVDADDWIDPMMFEEMYSSATKENADIAVCCVRRCSNQKKASGGMDLFFFEQYREGFHWRDVINKIPSLRAYSYNKIYRRNLLTENRITFPDIRIHTDNLFMYASVTAADKIVCINKAFYNYRIHGDGQLTVQADDRVFDVFKTYELLEDYLKEKGIYGELKEQVTKRKLEEYLRDFRKIKDNKNIRIPYFKMMHKELQNIELHDELLSRFPRRRRHILKLAKRNAFYHGLAAFLL